MLQAVDSACFFCSCVVHTWKGCFPGRGGLTHYKLFKERRQGVTFSGLLLGQTRWVPLALTSSMPWILLGYYHSAHYFESSSTLWKVLWTLVPTLPLSFAALFWLELVTTALSRCAPASKCVVFWGCSFNAISFPLEIVADCFFAFTFNAFLRYQWAPKPLSSHVFIVILLLVFDQTCWYCFWAFLLLHFLFFSSVFFHCGETLMKQELAKSFQLAFALGLGTSICSYLGGRQLFLLFM